MEIPYQLISVLIKSVLVFRGFPDCKFSDGDIQYPSFHHKGSKGYHNSKGECFEKNSASSISVLDADRVLGFTGQRKSQSSTSEYVHCVSVDRFRWYVQDRQFVQSAKVDYHISGSWQ